MSNSAVHYEIRNLFLFCFPFFAELSDHLDTRLVYMRHGKGRINSFLAKKLASFVLFFILFNSYNYWDCFVLIIPLPCISWLHSLAVLS